jgi:hypothetical protein
MASSRANVNDSCPDAILAEHRLELSKPRFRRATYTRYKGIIENDLLKASIASLPVQKLRPSLIEQYYVEAKVSASTLTLHHAILHRALRKAAKDGLLPTNPANDLDGKPRRSRDKLSEDAQKHCWTAAEARAFLVAAKAAAGRVLQPGPGQWRSQGGAVRTAVE